MSGKNGKGIHMVTFLLLVVGGLNWLILGLFNWDIGELFGGQDAIVSKVIYILVGLAAIYEIASHKKSCSCCGGGCSCGAKKEGGQPSVPSTPPTDGGTPSSM